jgi:DNA polymerase
MINHETKKLLETTRDILSFQKNMGVTEIALTPEIEKFLGGPATETRPNKIRPTKQSSSPVNIRTESMFSPAPESALNLPLTEIYQDIKGCSKCPLHKGCKQIVPGCGPAGAKLFIIEDQPTATEEESGHPFAGESGELFDKMMKAIGLERSEIYLTSIVKCRTAADKDPNPDEIRTCLTYLARQIAAVNPVIICTMGPLAARVLTGNRQSLFRFRGKLHDFHGTPLLPSFHPRFLLNNNEMKKGSWTDLQLIQKKIS